MRFPFNSLLSRFRSRQEAAVKFFRTNAPCETVAISYKSDDGNDCRYEFAIPAPITVRITFSNGRHICLNSEGKNEHWTVSPHDRPPLPLWTGDGEVLSSSAAETIQSVPSAFVQEQTAFNISVQQ